MPNINRLLDVDVRAISIVRKGANGRRIFLFKSDDDPPVEFQTPSRIIKEDGDWSVFYTVVAEPGFEEKPGLHGDQSMLDVWDSPDEIRKAAHGFIKNGALINKMHESLEPFGKLVESSIALADFKVGDETIKKGSWYIGVEPTAEGREAIDNGEFTGVSIQGTGVRLAKGDEDHTTVEAIDLDAIDDDAVAAEQEWMESRISKDAALVPDRPGANNWIDRTGTGNLPKYIGDIAGDLITERGKSVGNAIQMAIGIVRNWCRGQGNVKPDTRAKACAAVAEFNAKRAQAKLSKLDVPDAPADERTVLQKIRDLVTGADDDCGCEGIEKDSATLEEDMDETKFNELAETVKEQGEKLSSLDGIEDRLTESISKALDGKITEAVEKATADESGDDGEKPTAESLSKSLEEIAASVSDANEAIEKLSGEVDALAAGDSAQGDDPPREEVSKSKPLAGLLS